MGDDVSRTTKDITNAKIASKATMASKVIVETMVPKVIVVTMRLKMRRK
jgi:hypothetical protein